MVHKELARLELGWWMAHHRRNYDDVIELMTREYQILYNIQEEDEARECVMHRIYAAQEHDKAEELEDSGNQAEADKHWEKAREHLEKHFEILSKYMK